MYKYLTVSQESQPASTETEVTIYARIGDKKGLAQAFDHETQIQAEVKLGNGRRMRVRMTEKPDQPPTYVLTTKQAVESSEEVRSFIEQDTPITQEVFETFKSIVDTYQHKHRYYFRIEKVSLGDPETGVTLDIDDLLYEVDVFKNNKGEFSDWCKIDLEIQDLTPQLKEKGINIQDFKLSIGASKLPFKPTDFIVMGSDTTEEDKKRLDEIYETQFLIHNFKPAQAATKAPQLKEHVDDQEEKDLEAPEEDEDNDDPPENTSESD